MPPTPPAATARSSLPLSTRPRAGLTWITRENLASVPSGRSFLDFGLLRLRSGETRQFTSNQESVFILLAGRARVEAGERSAQVERSSLFDAGPTAVQCGAHSRVAITALRGETEWAVVRASNSRLQGVHWYSPHQVASEDRGAGLAQDACRRTVRTIFDHQARPDSELVVGEVVNRAGRWSSYPPHHHPQPELYHYRFTRPQGYGHAELGDDVLKVKSGDTVEIPGGLDHAQVAAPGYGMYYLWVVRHLPRRPYRGFQFTRDHTWLLDPKQPGWSPRGDRRT